MLPQEMDTESSEYIQDFSTFAPNRDAYEFPYDEFHMGRQIEQSKNPNFNIIDVAQKVINNLKQDLRFYSNLAGQ
jgi:hypothetical protein